jgi:hypothetical protein
MLKFAALRFRPFHPLEISSWFGHIQSENQNPFFE